MSFIILLICFIGGILLKWVPLFDERSPAVVNNLLIYFFLPALTLYHVPKIHFEYEQAWLTITPFIIYLSSFIFFKMVSWIKPLQRKTEGALVMCSGIGSISFVGFPVFEFLYGAEGLGYGIILSLGGTILVFNTLGLYTGLSYAQKTSVSALYILRRMFRFPPFIAFVLATLFNAFDFQYPALIDLALMKLAQPFAVLALLAIGMQLDFSLDRKVLKLFLLGQFYKLILAPVLIYILMWHVLGMHDLIGRVCILGAAIGSMNAISIVAAQLGLNPKLAVAMPAIGIPISVPLLFLTDSLLK